MKCYSIELFVKGKVWDIMESFVMDDYPEQALLQAQAEIKYMNNQEWFDEHVELLSPDLVGCKDWFVKITEVDYGK